LHPLSEKARDFKKTKKSLKKVSKKFGKKKKGSTFAAPKNESADKVNEWKEKQKEDEGYGRRK
jgi:hypothetical protein